jgi:spermidine synthase
MSRILHYRWSSITWLHILFFFSGFPALFYQIVWQRSLFILYGVNIESVTLVVTAFMLGLGLGSLFGGWLSRIAERFALHIFGGLELGIGLFGFFSLAIFQWIGDITVQVNYVQMLGVSFALTCIPTFLMGMTLPLFVAYLVRRQPDVGRSVGSLYCVNTLGAAAACFLLAFFVMRVFGQQGTVSLAAGINICLGIGALCAALIGRSKPAVSYPASTAKNSFSLGLPLAIFLSALSGYIALSYEIVWIRLYSIASGGVAAVFALVLAYYLTGLGLGAWLSRLYGGHPRRVLAYTTLFVSVLSFLFIPFMAWISQYEDYSVTLSYVGILSILLGFNLPLLSQCAIRADARAGSSVSYLYFANIVGSVAGSLITGFILLDYWSLQQISVFLACAGLLLAMIFSWRLGLLCIVLGIIAWVSAPTLFEHVYEKLMYKKPYESSEIFVNVIENKQGVITVSQDGIVYGGGVYDGRLSLDLIQDRNGLIRAFMIGAFHPEPKEVLMIGLASGSWAQVLAHHPAVKKLTIVEINPGYLELIRKYPKESSILKNPKVEIIIDDGRRWLRRNPARQFDLIVMNTSFHWRDHVSNLLSKDFLESVRSALKPGGIFYYNTTGSKEVLRTAIQSYPHALRMINFVAVSDSPIILDKQRFRSLLKNYKIDGQPVLNLSRTVDQQRLEELVAWINKVESRDSLLKTTEGAKIITDDNMGVEWGR